MQKRIKKTLILASLFAAGCTTTTIPDEVIEAQAMSVDSLLDLAEALVGDTVVLRGEMSVNKHTEKARFHVLNAKHTSRIRIYADKMSDGIKAEDAPKEVAIRGIVCERQTTREDLEAAEAKLRNDTSAHAQKRLQNISAKKAYLELNKLDYISEYYIDGLEYRPLSSDK